MYRLDPKLLNPAEVTTAALRKLGVEPESSHVTTSQTPSDKQVQPLPAADPATLLGAGVQVTRFSNRFNFRSGVSAQIVM
jgi:hypothetical protein